MPIPMALIILDGLGHSESIQHNPLRHISTPTLQRLWENHPHVLLKASGEAVGLPEGQMGNSEVGHLHIGAGRKVAQDLSRISHDIEHGILEHHTLLLHAIHQAKQQQKAVHLIGLLSPGGVHSHEDHLHAMVKFVAAQGIEKNYTHAILDGRDTPPRSAMRSVEKLQDLYSRLGHGRIASLIGRYYAMDRDHRWERTQKAYDCLTLAAAEFTADEADIALRQAYARGESDEFVSPILVQAAQQPPARIEDGDVIIFMNFRADRARQLTRAFNEKHFEGFHRQKHPKLAAFVTLTEYDSQYQLPCLFPATTIENTLGEVVAKAGLKQLRLAETEKYAHVTYFFNGGRETPFAHEDRLLIPSPKVATYDLKPEMSAVELTDRFIDAIQSRKYDFIVCNYANPDMVGHTGNEKAALQAITTVDQCLARVLDALQQVGGEAVITADHGNIETMFDHEHQQPHTAHTTNLVPLFYVGRKAQLIQHHGALDDVAPTVLYLMGLTVPEEMQGRCLLEVTAHHTV